MKICQIEITLDTWRGVGECRSTKAEWTIRKESELLIKMFKNPSHRDYQLHKEKLLKVECGSYDFAGSFTRSIYYRIEDEEKAIAILKEAVESHFKTMESKLNMLKTAWGNRNKD